MSGEEWQQITSDLRGACAGAGFDLLQPFAISAHNAIAEAEQRLPDLGRTDALGIVIGNTRRLWPAFTRARLERTLRREAHPLDSYVEQTLPGLVARATARRREIVFAHVTVPRAFAVQRVAQNAGLACISPSHLAIHPQHGPWFALRAVVIIDVPGPTTAALAPRPCDTCDAPCVAALEHAVAVSGPKLNGQSVAANAAAWIAVRDACPVGRASRYDEEQLAYHYGLHRQLPGR